VREVRPTASLTRPTELESTNETKRNETLPDVAEADVRPNSVYAFGYLRSVAAAPAVAAAAAAATAATPGGVASPHKGLVCDDVIQKPRVFTQEVHYEQVVHVPAIQLSSVSTPSPALPSSFSLDICDMKDEAEGDAVGPDHVCPFELFDLKQQQQQQYPSPSASSASPPSPSTSPSTLMPASTSQPSCSLPSELSRSPSTSSTLPSSSATPASTSPAENSPSGEAPSDVHDEIRQIINSFTAEEHEFVRSDLDRPYYLSAQGYLDYLKKARILTAEAASLASRAQRVSASSQPIPSSSSSMPPPSWTHSGTFSGGVRMAQGRKDSKAFRSTMSPPSSSRPKSTTRSGRSAQECWPSWHIPLPSLV